MSVSNTKALKEANCKIEELIQNSSHKTFDRYHLYGIDSQGVEHFIDSDLSVEGSVRRSKDYLRVFPSRYKKMLIRTTNGDYSKVVENEYLGE